MNVTLQQVEERTKIGLSTLSDVENGKREPKLIVLKELADFYQRPMAFFLEETELPVETVLWRAKPTSPTAEEVQVQLLRLAEQFHNLERWCDEVQELDLSFASGRSADFKNSHAEKLAHDFRSRYGLGERPGQSLLRVVEEVCKIKVFHLAFDPSCGAACTFSEQYGAAILLNVKNTPWRRNFDLAHELFHLLTWKIFRKSGDAAFAEASEMEEKLADFFARNLLMPQEPLRIAIDSQLNGRTTLNFDDLFEVARQFDVSVEALVWQMTFIYGLAEQQAKATIYALRERIAFWDERQRVATPIRPLRFEVLAKESLRKGLISTGKYAEYLGINRREAMRHVEQESIDDAEVEIAHP
jgi:Zn-dependent peptidase ImmA (M78 family)/transcriptional regulator with XRE-family HTH domain